MIPSRIVPHILFQQILCCLELPRIPQAEPLDKPLPVTPDVVIFHVQLEHLHQEILLPLRAVELVNDCVAMVPDLVVLLVFECDAVEPFNLLAQVLVRTEEDACAVEPMCRISVVSNA
jgi:hypothetical protein